MSDQRLDEVKLRLKGLKELLDTGLIDQRDFESQKAAVLSAYTSPSSQPAPSTVAVAVTPPVVAVAKGGDKDDDDDSKPGLKVQLEVDAGDPTMTRCGLLARFSSGTAPGKHGQARKKVVILLLDRSGSMRERWPSVVDAVQASLPPGMIEDPDVAVRIIVYAAEAEFVSLDGGLGETISRLRTVHAPKNQITVFRAAFRAATEAVAEAVARWDKTAQTQVQLLLFTDGADTSIDDARGHTDLVASAASARKHYDEMKRSIGALAQVLVFVAAFGADHDVKQCQQISDRYTFIDRAETLREKMTSLIGEMAAGSGFCRLLVKLPAGLTLFEPIPPRLPLSDGCSIEYEFFVQGRLPPTSPAARFSIELTAVGFELLEHQAAWAPRTVGLDTFEQFRLFIDRAASQLRLKSAQLTARTPNAKDIADLRALLDLVRRDIHEARRAACSFQRGALASEAMDLFRKAKTSSKLGGAAGFSREKLRAGLAVIDGLADRLSHVVGEHERGVMTDARVAAILGDSRQHLPQAVRRQLDLVAISNVERIRQRRRILESLPPPGALSEFGSSFTKDVLSCCDAREVAAEGDAHFFFLVSLDCDRATNQLKDAVDGDGFVSFEAFSVMKYHAVRQGGEITAQVRGVSQNISAVWLPVFWTEDHFRRAVLLAPDALGLTLQGDPLAFKPSLFPVLFEIFGRSVVQIPPQQRKEVDWLMLLHKLRSLHAFAAITRDTDGRPLLDVSRSRLARFDADPTFRQSVPELFVIVADALLSPEPATPDKWRQLCGALFAETVRRNFDRTLRAGKCNEGLEIRSLFQGMLGIATNTASHEKGMANEHAPFSSVVRLVPANAVDQVALFGSATPTGPDKEFSKHTIAVLASAKGSLAFDHAASLFHTLCQLSDAARVVSGSALLPTLFSVLDAAIGGSGGDMKKALADHDAILAALKSPVHREKFLGPQQVAACILQSAVLHADSFNEHVVASSAARVIQRAYSAHRVKSGKRPTATARPQQQGGVWWEWRHPVSHADDLLCAARSFAVRFEVRAAKEAAKVLAEKLAVRRELLLKHPICATRTGTNRCWCGAVFNDAHAEQVWGAEAAIDSPELYRQARSAVLAERHFAGVSMIDAATEKEYRRLGGTFTFAPGDTFIKGLHRRTVDLLREWEESGRVTKAQPRTAEAVAELMLRLRWDDRIPQARAHLARILEFLWLAISGHGPKESTIPSALFDL